MDRHLATMSKKDKQRETGTQWVLGTATLTPSCFRTPVMFEK